MKYKRILVMIKINPIKTIYFMKRLHLTIVLGNIIMMETMKMILKKFNMSLLHLMKKK